MIILKKLSVKSLIILADILMVCHFFSLFLKRCSVNEKCIPADADYFNVNFTLLFDIYFKYIL